MKLLPTFAACALLHFAFSSFAVGSAGAYLRQAFSAVPMAELPAKAADLVKNARVRDRAVVTVAAVEAALAINANIAPAVVGAIARAVPDMASIAAGKAAELRARQAAEIARAACRAAPSKGARIAAAVCRAAPADYRKVVAAIAQIAPASNTESLRAIASVLPEQKPSIDSAAAASRSRGPVVASVLGGAKPVAVEDPIAMPAAAGAPAVRGPAVDPPYVPASGGETSVTPATSGTVPRGGRNYAMP